MAAHQPSLRRHLTGVVLVVVASLILLGCGDDGDADGGIPDGYPTVAPPEVDGRFDVTNIVAEGAGVDIGSRTAPVVTIDIVTGEIAVDLICNRHLGAYTLDPDGRASITLTGGTTEDCGADADLEKDILALFDRVDRWESSAGGFQLTSAAGDLVGLIRS